MMSISIHPQRSYSRAGCERPYNHRVREAWVERHGVFDLLHMFLNESDVQGLDVAVKMLDLPSAYKWEMCTEPSASSTQSQLPIR